MVPPCPEDCKKAKDVRRKSRNRSSCRSPLPHELVCIAFRICAAAPIDVSTSAQNRVDIESTVADDDCEHRAMSFVQGTRNCEPRYDLPKMRWRWNFGRESYRRRTSRATAKAKRRFLRVRLVGKSRSIKRTDRWFDS